MENQSGKGGTSIQPERKKSFKECFIDCNTYLTDQVRILHKESHTVTKMREYTNKIIHIF